MTITIENTEKDLMDAILEDPFDLDLRLVFCNWLEEHKQIDRGQFISAQLEIDKLTKDEFLILPESPKGQILERLNSYCRLIQERNSTFSLFGFHQWEWDLLCFYPYLSILGMGLSGKEGSTRGFF